MKDKLVIASAGSGKTEHLVKEALKITDKNVLITTFTIANEEEIRKRFVKLNKCVPKNISILTWFSFLIKHGAKPYQGCLFDETIKGLVLVSGQSPYGIPESNTANHYFTNDRKIYSDKLAKFVVRCNEKSNGAVIKRLEQIYSHIFIDEVQDLAGYDLEVLKLIFASNINTLMVGDPRQATYSTNNSSKNKKFKQAKILNFFEDKTINVDIDDTSLCVNHRSTEAICNLSNKLYPNLPQSTSGNTEIRDMMGITLVKKDSIEKYLIATGAVQLRWDSRVKVSDTHRVLTFGDSKGQAFDAILIYPTTPFTAWLKNNATELKPLARSRFYVGLTRARFSLGIVYDRKPTELIDGFIDY